MKRILKLATLIVLSILLVVGSIVVPAKLDIYFDSTPIAVSGFIAFMFLMVCAIGHTIQSLMEE